MNPVWIDVAGWTLLHFLWQGAAVAAIACAALVAAAPIDPRRHATWWPASRSSRWSPRRW